MVSFITQLLGSSEEMRNIKHVVDVGAGQVRFGHFLGPNHIETNT